MKKWIAAALFCAGAFAQQHTKDGDRRLPDYRKWIYLGSGLGMTYTGKASDNPPFTNVFAEPRAYDQFMKNGVWPDKTVLVAEMRASATGVSINKNGFVQTPKVIAVEVEVKDSAKGGWAFYGFENGSVIGKLFPLTAACYS